MFPNNPNGFQQSIASATADNVVEVVPHHPITCLSKLYYNEDGSFGCEHVTVPSDDARTHRALNHSIACLILEEAVRQFSFVAEAT